MILNIGYWKHDWRPIFFTLFVNYFFVRYDREEHAKHLVTSLSKHYTISRDWEVKIYMGMTLEWGFKKYYIRVSIIDYIVEALIRFRHNAPKKAQYQPHPHTKSNYGEKLKYAKEGNSSLIIGKDEKFYPRSHRHFTILHTGSRLHNTSCTRIHSNKEGQSEKKYYKKILSNSYIILQRTLTQSSPTYP